MKTAIVQSRLELNPGWEPGVIDLDDPNFVKIALVAQTHLKKYFPHHPRFRMSY
jgi:hypothetical protein